MSRILFLAILIIAGMLMISGCESVQCDGFSIGATYLNAELLTNSTINAEHFGEWATKQETKVEGLMPIFMLNFKFK